MGKVGLCAFSFVLVCNQAFAGGIVDGSQPITVCSLTRIRA